MSTSAGGEVDGPVVPPHGWTCFRCGETCATVDEAQTHFLPTQLSVPVYRSSFSARLGAASLVCSSTPTLGVLKEAHFARP